VSKLAPGKVVKLTVATKSVKWELGQRLGRWLDRGGLTKIAISRPS
jgi:hypothetical protein